MHFMKYIYVYPFFVCADININASFRIIWIASPLHNALSEGVNLSNCLNWSINISKADEC